MVAGKSYKGLESTPHCTLTLPANRGIIAAEVGPGDAANTPGRGAT